MTVLIDLPLTMKSGQTPEFVWNESDGKFRRLVEGRKCELWFDGKLRFTKGFEAYAMEFLRGQDDLDKIYKKINTDEVVDKATKRYRGLRITKNDPWETTVAFICSANNNIKRIRKNVQSLMVNGTIMAPGEILKADLRDAKLGFREKSLKITSKMVAEGHSLEEIHKMKYGEAVSYLTQLHGVGDKVANCILLFGCGFLESFPIDTWIRKVMSENYFGGKKTSDARIRSFAQDRWGKYAGYANQYLFCYARRLKADAI